MDTFEEWKHQRIKNTYKVPKQFEEFIYIGYLVCFDAFLDVFTHLPIRILQYRKRIDILVFLSIFLLVCLLDLDIAYLYHFVRGQSVIKLYVIFNTLEIADKLCASFGLDILEIISSSKTTPCNTPMDTLKSCFFFLANLIVLVLYGACHTMVLLFQLVALNVAVNSHNNALLTLLISNQFAELKTSVFKKFESENLFQLGCSDVVERLHLSIFIFLTFIRNIADSSEPQGQDLLLLPEWLMPDYLIFVVDPLLTVVVSELAVDWLKHGFITKFNGIKPSVYHLFAQVIARDVLRKSHLQHHNATARRLGFNAIPAVVLFIKNMLQLLPSWFENSDLDVFIKAPKFDNQSFIVSLVVCYAVLWVLKATVRQQLFNKSKILANEPAIKNAIGGPREYMYAPIHKIPKHDINRGKSNVDNTMKPPQELTLENIDRFAIWKSRVPL